MTKEEEVRISFDFSGEAFERFVQLKEVTNLSNAGVIREAYGRGASLWEKKMKSISRGLLFYGLCCGKDRPWKSEHKTWHYVYRTKMGWPDKPIEGDRVGQSHEEELISWAVEDFKLFRNLDIDIFYHEANERWYVGSLVMLGPDLLPREIKCMSIEAITGNNEHLAEFCKVMDIEYKTPCWFLTSVPFDGSETTSEEK